MCATGKARRIRGTRHQAIGNRGCVGRPDPRPPRTPSVGAHSVRPPRCQAPPDGLLNGITLFPVQKPAETDVTNYVNKAFSKLFSVLFIKIYRNLCNIVYCILDWICYRAGAVGGRPMAAPTGWVRVGGRTLCAPTGWSRIGGGQRSGRPTQERATEQIRFKQIAERGAG